jgi:hypothetical protein
MVKIQKNFVLFVCALTCVLLIVGPIARTKVEAQSRIPNLTRSNSYTNSTILIEAFVVWVKLSALDDLGVSPIGEKPNSVTIENILTCLKDGNSAKVGSGVKVATQNRGKGQVELEETIYIAQEKQIKIDGGTKQTVSRTYRPYSVGKFFAVSANGIGESKISVSFDFRQEEVQKVNSQNEAPPHIIKRIWSGAVNIQRGKASIVGATQDEQKAYFLVISADTRNN